MNKEETEWFLKLWIAQQEVIVSVWNFTNENCEQIIFRVKSLKRCKRLSFEVLIEIEIER
jgi:hypothetical protein